MAISRQNLIRWIESKRILRTERRPGRLPRVQVKPTARQAFEVFRKSPEFEKIISRIPKARTLGGWTRGTEVAYFSVCGKSGSARWLDIWDPDLFDGFTDMPSSVRDCRAWFSHTGYTTWGSGETKTGRVNCAFDAKTAGDYSCVVRLQSYPAGSSATVECLVDNYSFGPLYVTGTITWPHFSTLSAGLHHFRIRQVNGSFFFLSVTVYRF